MRARNIKPGYWKNEALAECPLAARLLFAGLWGLADREGRLEDRPIRIKGEVFPFDSIEVEPLLEMLEAKGFILRYVTSGGLAAIQVVEFRKHQSPHYSEKPSVITPPYSRNVGAIKSGDSGSPGGSKPQNSGNTGAIMGGEFSESNSEDVSAIATAVSAGNASANPVKEGADLMPLNSGSDGRIMAGEFPDSEKNASLRGGRNPLNPDSLNPDSLNPESSLREPRAPAPASASPPTPSPGEACAAMRKAGLAEVSHNNPDLLAMLAQGMTVAELADAATVAVKRKKGFVWALSRARGQREDAAEKAALPAQAPAAPTETAYQRTMRERVQSIAPSIAAKAPTSVKPTEAEVFDVTARTMG